MKKKEYILTNHYHDLIYKIEETKNLEQLDNISKLLKNNLESKDYLKLNHLLIFKLSNIYFSKALILKKKFHNKILPYSFKTIFSLLKSNNFISPLYENFFERNEMKNIFKDTPKKKDKKKCVLNIFQKNLKNIFNISKIEDNNFGYSIIDLNGNFLWFCEKSEILFENFKNTKIKNFFDLLIPFSKNLLFEKFDKKNKENFSLFKKNARIGKKIFFSYVIYSQIKVKKFEKYLYDLSPKNFQEFENIIFLYKKKKTIFNRYLKELTSKCKLIIIKITKEDIFNIKFYGEEKIIFYTKNLKLVKLSKFDLENKNFFLENEFLYKKVIYLETKESKNILNFNYMLMKDDLVIKNVERDIVFKYKKNIRI